MSLCHVSLPCVCATCLLCLCVASLCVACLRCLCVVMGLLLAKRQCVASRRLLLQSGALHCGGGVGFGVLFHMCVARPGIRMYCTYFGRPIATGLVPVCLAKTRWALCVCTGSLQRRLHDELSLEGSRIRVHLHMDTVCPRMCVSH